MGLNKYPNKVADLVRGIEGGILKGNARMGEAGRKACEAHESPHGLRSTWCFSSRIWVDGGYYLYGIFMYLFVLYL